VKSANVKKADSSTTKKNQKSSKKGTLEMMTATVSVQHMHACACFKWMYEIINFREHWGIVACWFSKLKKISVHAFFAILRSKNFKTKHDL
jgi:hypothetical protein